MITEDYVSFETAKLLKEKGFDVPLWFYYDQDKEIMLASWSGWEEDWNNCLINNGPSPFISAPTLQMAMKWLREVHNWIVNIEFQMDCPTFKWRIYEYKYPCKEKHTNFQHYRNYEECVEAAIKYCLENLI